MVTTEAQKYLLSILLLTNINRFIIGEKKYILHKQIFFLICVYYVIFKIK